MTTLYRAYGDFEGGSGMTEDNKVLTIGDEVRFTDIVTIIAVEEQNIEVRTDAGYEFWTTRDNLDK